jgi:hypothetical protein
MTKSTLLSNVAEDLSLQPPSVDTRPALEYSTGRRLWQGIPGIERAQQGRLLATWYSGGETEGPENYVLLVSTEDDGGTWSDPLLVIDPPSPVRAFDPVLWHDPQGVLWWFWSQSYGRASRCLGDSMLQFFDIDTDLGRAAASFRWSDDVMMNKPTVLRNGMWLASGAVWSHPHAGFVTREDMRELRFSNVYASKDKGGSWSLLGRADVPDRQFDDSTSK